MLDRLRGFRLWRLITGLVVLVCLQPGDAYSLAAEPFLVKNSGQEPAGVAFSLHGKDAAARFLDGGVHLDLFHPQSPARIRIEFPGGEKTSPVGSDWLDAGFTYIRAGQDPIHTKACSGVRYQNVWPGVDVLFHTQGNQVKYELQLAAGVDPSSVSVRYRGADNLAVEPDGRLSVKAGGVVFHEDGLLVYQPTDAGPRTLDAAYRVSGDTVYFEVKGYDPSFPVVIDPEVSLLWSSFLGGAASYDSPKAIMATDDSLYVTGETYSADFPATPGAFSSSHKGLSDVFVARFSLDGSQLLQATFLGGTDDETAQALAVGPDGDIYISGFTFSNDFPVSTGAYDTTFNGGSDAFAARLSPDLSTLRYATYLGGNRSDSALGIAVNTLGQAVVVGQTDSANFPVTPGVLDTTHNGNLDAFVTILGADGASLVRSTFLGGSGSDWASSVLLGSDGNIYLAGLTQSGTFPVTPGVFQPSSGGGFDGFVASIKPNLSSLNYASYLGGSNADLVNGIALGSDGSLYATGVTRSSNFPTTPGVLQTSIAGAFENSFVSRISPTGSSLVYSTYLGAAQGDDRAFSVAVEPDGSVWVAGLTTSSGFPVTPDALSGSISGAQDGFIASLASDASSLRYGTFLGGGNLDFVAALSLKGNRLYVTGETFSSDYPTTPGAYKTAYSGLGDAFVTALSLTTEEPDTTPPTTPVVTAPFVALESGNELSASWISEDPESGIAQYFYAIGVTPTDPGSGYLLDWTSAGTDSGRTLNALALSSGTIYYWYVKAVNGQGLESAVGVSAGTVVVESILTQPGTAKLAADSDTVALSGVVVTSGEGQIEGRLYVQNPDRSSGIAVQGVPGFSVGDVVTLAGRITTQDGERIVLPVGMERTGSVPQPTPLTVGLAKAAGADFFYDAQSGAGQRGIDHPQGQSLTTTGLLVSFVGRVTAVNETGVSINDGSIAGPFGVRVSGEYKPEDLAVGAMLKVTGISSLYLEGGESYLLLRPRSSEDFDVLIP